MQLDIKNVADAADMIINGYAYTQEGKYIRTLKKSGLLLRNTIKRCISNGLKLPILVFMVKDKRFYL